MSEPTGKSTGGGARPPLLRNWLSLAGLVIALGSLFSFLLLFILDSAAHLANPYIGILTYIVAPGFLITGLLLALLGALWHRHRLKAAAPHLPALQINLSQPRDRRILEIFIAGSVCFLLLSAVGSYKTYHFTESVQFCGQTCHTVMKPELTTYLHGPHARVACVSCHIGPGATWFVRSKLSGTYQVYATLFDKFPRPIATPIKNLRPAQQTCNQCHWPRKFFGNLDRTFHFFLGDETNTPFSVRLILKVGGGDPTHGPVGGIHWHMSISNRIEYIASDKARQHIPWVRLTDPEGVVTVFREAGFTNEIRRSEIRQMDCIDCHNRPAHRFVSPQDAVNLAIELGHLDRALPYIKSNAVYALTRPYPNTTAGRDGIATYLANQYADDPRIRQAIPYVQQIYADNFFPAMKSDWSVYPDNIGHKNWPGCARCHDGYHKSDGGNRTIRANDCNACHIILAQGRGAQLLRLSAEGQQFDHPGGELDPAYQCTDCHSGGL
jgi:nitrate/TMAO reductase-like tetraheme cytochrome c subunit